MASHEFIPPDILEPVIRKIADEFVTGGVSFEVLQAGYYPFETLLILV
jgi:protein SDA1